MKGGGSPRTCSNRRIVYFIVTTLISLIHSIISLLSSSFIFFSFFFFLFLVWFRFNHYVQRCVTFIISLSFIYFCSS